MHTKHSISRKEFLAKGLAAGTGLVALPAFLSAQQKEKPPAIASALVSEFVRVAHSDLNKVKQMLEETPLLLNAAWDWGGGDFETAIGAAGHMGLKDTANYLLEKGGKGRHFRYDHAGENRYGKSHTERLPRLAQLPGPAWVNLIAPC